MSWFQAFAFKFNLYRYAWDWTDENQYYPTVLGADNVHQHEDEGAAHESKVQDVMTKTGEGEYLVMQLPYKLSLGPPPGRGKSTMKEEAPVDEELRSGQATELSLLDEGKLGELCVHTDGTVGLYKLNPVA
jgi:hypothetical protein